MGKGTLHSVHWFHHVDKDPSKGHQRVPNTLTKGPHDGGGLTFALGVCVEPPNKGML